MWLAGTVRGRRVREWRAMMSDQGRPQEFLTPRGGRRLTASVSEPMHGGAEATRTRTHARTHTVTKYFSHTQMICFYPKRAHDSRLSESFWFLRLKWSNIFRQSWKSSWEKNGPNIFRTRLLPSLGGKKRQYLFLIQVNSFKSWPKRRN